MCKQLYFFGLLALAGNSISFTWAELPSGSVGKNSFNLFDPTPDSQLRDFSTDRPDKTESAYTVDAGHFQHETDIINFVYDSEGGESSSSILAMAPNLKFGLTNNSDLQIVVSSFNYVRQQSSGKDSKQSGFGDILLRLKVNLWETPIKGFKSSDA